jgi:hypothetical protein
MAVESGHPEIVHIILEGIHNEFTRSHVLEARNGHYETALVIATRLGNQEILQQLIDAGANTIECACIRNQRNHATETPSPVPAPVERTLRPSPNRAHRNRTHRAYHILTKLFAAIIRSF